MGRRTSLIRAEPLGTPHAPVQGQVAGTGPHSTTGLARVSLQLGVWSLRLTLELEAPGKAVRKA